MVVVASEWGSNNDYGTHTPKAQCHEVVRQRRVSFEAWPCFRFDMRPYKRPRSKPSMLLRPTVCDCPSCLAEWVGRCNPMAGPRRHIHKGNVEHRHAPQNDIDRTVGWLSGISVHFMRNNA